MKYLIATDLHGSLVAAEKVYNAFIENGADKLVLLGDLYYHGPRNPLPEGYAPMRVAELLNSIKDKVIAVRGNCDAEIDCTISEFTFFDEYTTIVAGEKILFTHGQKHNKDCLPDEGCADIIIYGHFHINQLFKSDDIIAVNIASCALPKENCPPSYAILSEDGLKVLSFEGDEIIKILL